MQYQYPPSLPVSASKERIVEAITHHNVVIVAGQTGSGKTTQLPKMLLEMGLADHGKRIVHTQPRRIAARSVAERIAHELQVNIGQEVGFQVRFNDYTSPKTQLQVVTDGVLLAQIQRDPLLKRYSAIIIDEAHERSLNIDFLLGYCTQLLQRRHDLKLIITSATIDSQKFQHHFEQALHEDVPIIEIEGRTFPVDVRYEPLDGDSSLIPHFKLENSALHNSRQSSNTYTHDTLDLSEGVVRACAQLVMHSEQHSGDRDILVFAAGERDIREYEQALRQYFSQKLYNPQRHNQKPESQSIEIIPLFARLSAQEQHKIFESHTTQRIIITTNIAETSLTVPGIRYVVDTGLARISRYSKTTKVQKLPIEPIAQASANQRSGRCGRVSDGIAIRLYSEEDFLTRPQYTDPEIIRTSLSAVIVHMLSSGVAKSIDDITHFGFIDAPDYKSIMQGVRELQELQAISQKHHSLRLTRTGVAIAQLPVDVRLARMIVEAHRRGTPSLISCILVIVSFLSLQDPREVPLQEQEEARHCHARFADKRSDFLTILNLWEYLFNRSNTSNHALRKLCKQEYIHYLRVRQWRALYEQLVEQCETMHYTIGEIKPIKQSDADVSLPLQQQAHSSLTCTWDYDAIHQCMLAGLLSSLGMNIEQSVKASDFRHLSGAAKMKALKRAKMLAKNQYQGAHNLRFSIFPSSTLYKVHPAWIVATMLVETSQLGASYTAQIDPLWAEPLARHLTRTTYQNPHWSSSRNAVIADSSILLYGLPIVTHRTVQWDTINPAEARMLFIRHGLAEGNITQRFVHDNFIAHNVGLLEQSDDTAQRTRTHTVSLTQEDLVSFYDSVIPDDIVNLQQLASWWKNAWKNDKSALMLTAEKIARFASHEQDALTVSADDFPDYWHTTLTDGTTARLRLTYLYNPQNDHDGVTVHIPVDVLPLLQSTEFTWQVPGLLEDKILSTIRALPKQQRVQFVPAPQSAERMMTWLRNHATAIPGTPAWQETQQQKMRLQHNQEAMSNAGTIADITAHMTVASNNAQRQQTQQTLQNAAMQSGNTAVTATSHNDNNRPMSISNDNNDKKKQWKSVSLADLRSALSAHDTQANDQETALLNAHANYTPESSNTVHRQQSASQRDIVQTITTTDNTMHHDTPSPASSNEHIQLAQRNDTICTLPFADAFAQIATHTLPHIALLPDYYTDEVHDHCEGYTQLNFSIERWSKRKRIVIATGKDLRALQDQYNQLAQHDQRKKLEQKAKTAQIQGKQVLASTLLHDAGHSKVSRAESLWNIATSALTLPTERITSRWTNAETLSMTKMLSYTDYPNLNTLVDDVQYATAQRLLPEINTIETDNALAEKVEEVRNTYEDALYDTVHIVIDIADANETLSKALTSNASLTMLSIIQSIRAHSYQLLSNRFLRTTPSKYLPRIAMYLQADSERLHKALQDKQRDAQWAWQIETLQQRLDSMNSKTMQQTLSSREHDTLCATLQEVQWLMEELRISLWAQQLHTLSPVSVQRIEQILRKL